MTDISSKEQDQNAEVEARRAVNHALKALNDARHSPDRPRSIQTAQELLDQAHQQLAEARIANADND